MLTVRGAFVLTHFPYKDDKQRDVTQSRGGNCRMLAETTETRRVSPNRHSLLVGAQCKCQYPDIQPKTTLVMGEITITLVFKRAHSKAGLFRCYTGIHYLWQWFQEIDAGLHYYSLSKYPHNWKLNTPAGTDFSEYLSMK